MAVKTTAEQTSRRNKLVIASLIVLFIAALFLRAYWNLDAATEGGEFVLSAGSDPYYHKRAIDHIQENGYTTLIDDPMLNYPYGAVNPNPPLFEWSVAVSGHMLAPFFDATPTMSSEQVATWYAFLWSPAIFGALTLFPIYFIGKALFDRRAGLFAALFWTVSTTSIDTSGLGSADHDASVMFFASLAFLFYIKAIERFRGDGHWVSRWNEASAVTAGLGRFFRERRLGMMYALLSGLSLAGVALIWKGFPYVIGIMFAYAGLQMIVDHWRSRDSTGVFLGTLAVMVIGTVLAIPYYSAAGVENFLRPVWFLIAGFFVAGLVLVPTRDLPTILVMPAAIAVSILGIITAFFVVPDVATSLLYSTVYFKQTALYETIAEAHPADFSTLVFSIGPVPYFLAFVGFFVLMFTMKKHTTRAGLFALVWAAIAVFMATSAIRFVYNALPVLVVFAGFGMTWVITKLDFRIIRKTLAANKGNFWQGLRKGTSGVHVTAVILMVLLLVLPNTLLAADAALPPVKEAKIAGETDSAFVKNFVEKRLGAYGQGFIPGYWSDGLQWLDQYDSNITKPEDRPAFLAWWDYGHWAIYVGRHPAVADNFQNGYQYAANFLLAQNETQAVQLLSARLIDLVPDAKADEILTNNGVADASAARRLLESYGFVPEITLVQAAAILQDLETETGKSIRYFTTDVRMLPYDNPQTTGFIEQSSIFYAPVRLAEQTPDDYVAVEIAVGGRYLSQDEYKVLAKDPIRGAGTQNFQATGERLSFKEPFFNTMYWRGYIGQGVQGPFPVTGDRVLQALNQPAPGKDLTHFRLVYENDGLKTLEYFRGAVVSGTISEEGTPLAGVRLTAYDDAGSILIGSLPAESREGLDPDLFNVPHGTATTDADGKYSIIAPFALEGGGVTIVARTADGTEIGRTKLAITRADAAAQKAFTSDITVKKGNVAGMVFDDANGDGVFDAVNDTAAANVTVTIGGLSAVSDANGNYTIASVSSGQQTVTVDHATKTTAPRSAAVRVFPDDTTTHNVGLVAKPSTVSGFAYADANGDEIRDEGEGAAFTSITFSPDASVENNAAVENGAFTASDGAYTAELQPGTYTVTAETDVAGVTYTVSQTLVVSVGESSTLDLRLTSA